MPIVARTLLALLAAVAFTLPAGCGKVQNAQERVKASNDLKELGLAYHNYQDAQGRPPQSFDELNRKFPMSPGCATATVEWGAGVGGMCKDGSASEVILAHRPNPGAKGVLALYCDGSVKGITPEEFSAAKKARPLPTK